MIYYCCLYIFSINLIFSYYFEFRAIFVLVVLKELWKFPVLKLEEVIKKKFIDILLFFYVSSMLTTLTNGNVIAFGI